MPTKGCHPAAPHEKLRLPDWFVSGLMLDRALDAILRRATLDRRHDVPYLAGYSRDGKTIYIDRHIPETFTNGDRTVGVDRYLILHESVEKALIDQLDLHYQHAHQIATRAEEAAVRADRVSWRAYDRFMQRYIKKAGSERLTRVPSDLDLKPYRDEHDVDLMARIRKAEEAGTLPRPKRRGRMQHAGVAVTRPFSARGLRERAGSCDGGAVGAQSWGGRKRCSVRSSFSSLRRY
jgi:hypothetical protein